MRTFPFLRCRLVLLMLSRVFRWSASPGGSCAFTIASLLFDSRASGLLARALGCFSGREVELRGREEGATRYKKKSRWMSGAGSDRSYRAERHAPSKERRNHSGKRVRTKRGGVSMLSRLMSVTRLVTRALVVVLDDDDAKSTPAQLTSRCSARISSFQN